MSSSINKNVPITSIRGYFLDLINDPNTLTEIRQFTIAFIALTITCVVFYVAYYDKEALTNKFYTYSIFGILPVLIGLAITSKILTESMNINTMYFYGTLLFLLICSMYLFYRIMNPKSVEYVSYFMAFIFTLMAIVGLAIIYRIFLRFIINTRGWIGFFLKLIFLIPCLLIDLMESIFIELKSSSKMVITLFIIEILIILAYIYIHKSISSPKNSVVLLDKPTFLSTLQVIGEKDKLFIPINDANNPGKEDDLIRQNYSISMWIYVNQHSSSNVAYSKETNVFRYGYPNEVGGHPRITYFNNTSDVNKTDRFIVYVSNQLDASGILLTVPTQSWNHFVISYTERGADIFINGNLEKTVSIPLNSRPKYDIGDIVEVGEGDNSVLGGGLHGAICNVVYHKEPLTAFKVAQDYNLSRYRNPPTYS